MTAPDSPPPAPLPPLAQPVKITAIDVPFGDVFTVVFKASIASGLIWFCAWILWWVYNFLRGW